MIGTPIKISSLSTASWHKAKINKDWNCAPNRLMLISFLSYRSFVAIAMFQPVTHTGEHRDVHKDARELGPERQQQENAVATAKKSLVMENKRQSFSARFSLAHHLLDAGDLRQHDGARRRASLDENFFLFEVNLMESKLFFIR